MIINENDQFGKILKRLILNQLHIRRCYAGCNKITICPDGSIYPCDSFVGKENYKIGDIKK
ncbi:MAG: SPASM domain-containing protein [Blautia sp.]